MLPGDIKYSNYSIYLKVILFFLSWQPFLANCQVTQGNVSDSKGWKQGFWRSCSNGLCDEVYFLNDTLNGISKSYYQNKSLSSFGVYQAGKQVGTWYYFDEKGRTIMEISKIVVLKGTKNSYQNKGYLTLYNENGSFKEQGFALYDDPELDIKRLEFGNTTTRTEN